MGFQNVFGHKQKIGFAALSGPPAPVYGPYTIAFAAVVVGRGGVVTTAEKAYLTTFEANLGTDITQFDRLWIHGLSNNIAARTSFVNPSSTLITPINAPIFTPYLGYTGDGLTTGLDTNYNPRTQGVKYTLNNSSGFSYLHSNVIGGASFGSYDNVNAGAFLYPQFTSNTPVYYINSIATGTNGTGNSFGLSTVNRTGSTSLNLYKNGVFNTSSTVSSSAIPNLNMFLLGANYLGLFAPFAGTICASGFGSSNYNQLNFYNSLQTLGQSLTWAVTSLNTDLYAAYNFEGNAIDVSGNGNNGTQVNSPTFSAGKFLQGVDFNGTNYIKTSIGSFNPAGDFSVSIWIKPNNFVPFMGILDKFTFGGVPAGWGLDIPLPGVGFQNPRFTINTTAGTYQTSGTTALSTTTWTNIICIFAANTISIYKNGVLENSMATAGTIVPEPQELYMAGDNLSTLFLDGSLDAFNFWNRKLTPAEIVTLQNYQYPFY